MDFAKSYLFQRFLFLVLLVFICFSLILLLSIIFLPIFLSFSRLLFTFMHVRPLLSRSVGLRSPVHLFRSPSLAMFLFSHVPLLFVCRSTFEAVTGALVEVVRESHCYSYIPSLPQSPAKPQEGRNSHVLSALHALQHTALPFPDFPFTHSPGFSMILFAFFFIPSSHAIRVLQRSPLVPQVFRSFFGTFGIPHFPLIRFTSSVIFLNTLLGFNFPLSSFYAFRSLSIFKSLHSFIMANCSSLPNLLSFCFHALYNV